MPRVNRVEFEGAVYHILAYGNRRNSIVEDDVDRERFYETLKEVVAQCGWEIYAWALLDDHYQLLIRTPEPNLVRGMSWFQNTITKRYNAYHQQQGHLFAGRYKAILVEEGDALINAIHYVNLAVFRDKQLIPSRDELSDLKWTSVVDYQSPTQARRDLGNVDQGLSILGCADTEKGRDKFWKMTFSASGNEVSAYKASLRGGWLAGSEEFEREMSYKLRHRVRDRASYQRRKFEQDEEIAEELISAGLLKYDLTREDLLILKKNDWRKVEMALQIRKATTMNADWIGENLHMGTRGGISNAIRKYQAGS